jgi:hypothetical protein
VRVEKYFEKCVYVASLHLELLRHRDANDFATIQIGELETVSGRAENLSDLRSDEWLEIIGDRFFHAADLLRRLREKAIGEMLGEFAPAGSRLDRVGYVAGEMKNPREVIPRINAALAG